ncbi:putative NADH-DEPENDENT GLUTAMATE SYNTHASE domain protein [Mycobacterium xenopi 3993]|nr:putative NADH-DEPENDENT GLUTAMATE SYNTHASE domain protein [Mycobacterium xenopi 3993]
MADPTGFLKYTRRELPKRRPVELRLRDWREVYEDFDRDVLRQQATRCMDCGIPFCHNGCPLGNLIPEWNDLVRRGVGETRSNGCTPPTTFLTSPGGCARRRASRLACSGLTRIR